MITNVYVVLGCRKIRTSTETYPSDRFDDFSAHFRQEFNPPLKGVGGEVDREIVRSDGKPKLNRGAGAGFWYVNVGASSTAVGEALGNGEVVQRRQGGHGVVEKVEVHETAEAENGLIAGVIAKGLYGGHALDGNPRVPLEEFANVGSVHEVEVVPYRGSPVTREVIVRVDDPEILTRYATNRLLLLSNQLHEMWHDTEQITSLRSGSS